MPVTVRAARKKTSAPAPLSVRAFARLHGVSHTAVQQRITEGALPTSAKKIDGRWKITAAAAAAAEWAAHTRPRVADNGKRARQPSALAKATQRERDARAQLAELEYARKSGAVVPAEGVELRWSARVIAVRTKLLSLPSRAQQRLPHLTGADLVVLDRLVREALEELADERTPDTPANGDSGRRGEK